MGSHRRSSVWSLDGKIQSGLDERRLLTGLGGVSSGLILRRCDPDWTLLAFVCTLWAELQPRLPEDKREEAGLHSEKLEEAASKSDPKSRAWYSISARGLLEASPSGRILRWLHRRSRA
jgi:hypothetical protein